MENRGHYHPLYYGESNPNWKGGILWSAGRAYMYCPQHPHATKMGYVYRYRLVMEESLGRYLKRGEVVHHINGNVSDDRLENLELLTQSQHIGRHRKKMVIARWKNS